MQAHELVAIYDSRLAEGFLTLDRNKHIPHIVSMLALLDPHGRHRSTQYDRRTPQARNLRVHAQRMAEIRHELNAMVAAMGSNGFGQLCHRDRAGGSILLPEWKKISTEDYGTQDGSRLGVKFNHGCQSVASVLL
ncbi:hypothetical protein IWX50DRAFT_661097 [Phyllosticta citricarpa]